MNNNRTISKVYEQDAFVAYMRQSEKSQSTIEKYSSDVDHYVKWAVENGIEDPFENEDTAKATALDYKDYLRGGDNNPSTINVKLAAVNAYFRYKNYNQRIRYLKIQKKIFLDENRELSLNEYRKLVTTARAMGKERIALIMETMASTGMRVSELQYITVESLKGNKVTVDLKNKIRMIFLPQSLCLKLYTYAANSGIQGGYIFRTVTGESLSRKQIWEEMKWVSRRAGVASSKVFPHNMRHVFARTYYKQCKDIARLADVLGHSSLETTRVYLMDSGAECERQINSLGLVC